MLMRLESRDLARVERRPSRVPGEMCRRALVRNDLHDQPLAHGRTEGEFRWGSWWHSARCRRRVHAAAGLIVMPLPQGERSAERSKKIARGLFITVDLYETSACGEEPLSRKTGRALKLFEFACAGCDRVAPQLHLMLRSQ